MSLKQLSSGKIGLLTFSLALVLGLVLFVGFGKLAGIFTPGRDIIDSFLGSPMGWIALFGGTLIISSPIIGLTMWAMDRAVKSIIDKNKK